MGLLFLNPSLRTRVSTQIAASNLGLETVVLNADKDGWALEFEDGAVMNGTTVEHVKDAAAVLGQYFDVLGIRSFPSLTNRELDYQDHVFNSFATYSRIPVVSLESATLHPLQSLADAITVSETMVGTRRPKVVLAWAPHIKPLPQCVANSFAQWMGAWDAVDLHIAHPEGYDLEPEFTKHALDCTHNLSKAIEGADYVYFKNWSALEPYGSMPPTSTSWLLQPEELKNHARSAQIMHCLPVRRNVEVVDGLLDSAQSLIVRQARNRVWSAQAVLAEILERNG
jgi:N-succinyl-L-ornithine transcarbamylase